MRRNLSLIAAGLLVLFTLPLAAQESSLPERGGTPAFRLGPRAEAEVAYRALSALSFDERKELYGRIDSDLYPALWTIHFERFSVAHPELTTDQRALVAKLIDFVSSGVFDVPRERSDWELRVHAPVSYLGSEANRLLGSQLSHELLSQIGGPEPLSYGYLRSDSKGAIGTNTTCNCVVGSTDCGDINLCVGRPTIRCTLTQGCGPMFLNACDGLCQ